MEQNSEYIRLAADLTTDSIVDGPGLRAVIWTQGCPHNCPGCHNPETHSFNDGFVIDTSEIKDEIENLTEEEGITFSGGDPMMQVEACIDIAKFAKQRRLNIWCYTGFTFEELLEMSKSKPSIIEFLKLIDVLVDGKFILREKSLNLKFRGSRNQRIIDVPRSLKTGKIVKKRTLMKEDINKTIKKIEEDIYI